MPTQLFSGNSYISGTRFAGSFNSSFIIRDVEKRLWLLEPYNYPLFQYLFLQKHKSHTTNHVLSKYEWGQDELIQNLDTFSAVSVSTTSITLTVASTTYIVAGKRFKLEDTDETGTVSSVTNSTVFVALSDSGSTWTTPTVSTNIHWIGEVYSENSAVPTAVSTNKVMPFTYCQIQQKVITMSDRMIASTKNGGTYGGNDWDNQMRSRGLEMKRDVESTFWENPLPTTQSVSDNGSTVTRTLTGGILAQIQNNTAGFGTGFVDSYTGTFTEDKFDGFLKQKKYGSNMCTMFCGNDLAADVEKIVKARYSNFGAVKKYGAIEGSNNVDVIEYSAVGKTVDIVRVPLWEGKYGKRGVLLDDQYVELVNMADDNKGSRKMRIEMGIQANGVPNESAQLLTDTGTALKCAPAHCIIQGT
jgi:hypothetical protein